MRATGRTMAGRFRSRRGLVAVAAILLAAVVATGGCKSKSPQRQVVVYCSVDQAVAEPIIAEFQRRTGILVLARYDTEASKTVGLAQRIRAESDRPAADVFWSGEVFHTVRLAREGLLESRPELRPADWPSQYCDEQARWHGFALRCRVIAYNAGRVAAADAPRTLEDLLDARWKGRLVMANPQFGTTGGDIASWFAHYGPQRAREILQGLKANGVRIVEGNSTALRVAATGQADVALTDSDDVYAGQRNGWPVAMNFLDQGGRGVLVIPNTVAILKGAPHPREGQELAKFLLSEQTEEMLARSDSHNTPVHASLAEKYCGYAIGHPLDIGYEQVADQLPAAIAAAGEILGR